MTTDTSKDTIFNHSATLEHIICNIQLELSNKEEMQTIITLENKNLLNKNITVTISLYSSENKKLPFVIFHTPVLKVYGNLVTFFQPSKKQTDVVYNNKISFDDISLNMVDLQELNYDPSVNEIESNLYSVKNDYINQSTLFGNNLQPLIDQITSLKQQRSQFIKDYCSNVKLTLIYPEIKYTIGKIL